jgi:hypothetical protein
MTVMSMFALHVQHLYDITSWSPPSSELGHAPF